MPHSAPSIVLAGLLLLASALVTAQDPHLEQGPAHRLYAFSPFAHGYLHGYEMGYHNGDIDLQLSHAQREIKSLRDFRDGKNHYRNDFGDRSMFVKGYQYGFRVGYTDAMGGSVFRAVENLRELSHDLPDIDPQGAPILNDALTRGYTDGVSSGLQDGRSKSADYRPDASDCELALRFQEPPAKFYCSVYALGYRLGYSDGFHNQRPIPEPRRIAGER